MFKKNRGQVSTEYLIIISFVVFVVLVTMGIAFFYSSEIRDTIKLNQLDSFSQKIASQAESVYYAGEPSKIIVNGYLPSGVNEIRIMGNFIVFNISTSSGENVIAYKSNVNLTGSLSNNEGMKKIYLNATFSSVVISE